MKWTNVIEWLRAKVSRLGREGSRTPQVGAASLLPGNTSRFPGQSHRLPEEQRGVRGRADCGGGRQCTADGRCVGWGGGGERGRLPSQEDEELVALSGKATAGDASGVGRVARGSCPPTGPVLAPGAPYPQSLGEQMPGSLFPEGVGRGEAVDSLLTGTRWRVKCLSHEGRELGVLVAGGCHTHS